MKRIFLYFLICLILVLPATVFAEIAPKFKLPTAKSAISLSSYKGKLVYVDFWASWCGPCRKSFPWMTELQKKHRKDLKVIAINLDQNRAEAVKFLKQTPPGFTVAYDAAGKIAEAYNVKAMPSSYLIDRKGRIISKHAGFRNKDKNEVEAKINKLLSR